MNRVVLSGRLTKDPEVRVTSSNTPYVFFTLAVNRQFKTEDGQTQADFINCVAWRQQAELMGKFLDKGSLIAIEGKLQVRKYESNEGTRYVTEVVCDTLEFLETKADAEARRNSSFRYGGEPEEPFRSKNQTSNDDISDDIKDVADNNLPF